MTKKQKIIFLAISIALALSISFSTYEFFLINSYKKSLQSEINSCNESIKKSVRTSQVTAFAEIARSRGEVMERVTLNDSDILELQREVADLTKVVIVIHDSLIGEQDKEVENKLLKDMPKIEPTFPDMTDEIINEDTVEEVSTIEAERPAWKKVIQFWKWF